MRIRWVSIVSWLALAGCTVDPGSEPQEFILPETAAGKGAGAAGMPAAPNSPGGAGRNMGAAGAPPTPMMGDRAGGPSLPSGAGISGGSSGAGGEGGSAAPAGSGANAGSTGAQPQAGSDADPPDDGIPPNADYTPSPDNPEECPAEAPEDPIGPCIGQSVYVVCAYGTYTCICDWIHWICVG